ncbi:MAG: response regulator transcription factor [Cyanobacteria bacterium]|nr:response regulator transcription factor [Cyanobacteriota bacterium]
MAKILILDDDSNITTSLSEGLRMLDFVVDVAHNASDATEMMAVSQYDCLIVDWQMPHKSGIEFVTELRRNGEQVAVLMLTGKSADEDKSTGLDTGADDYLTKPFAFRELVSRLRALLRRPRTLQSENLEFGDIVLNTVTRQVWRAAQELPLTRQEYLLLEFLMRNRNQIFSSEVLIERAWSTLSESSPDTVRAHMANLRKKLKVHDGDCPIKTVHGQGYVLRD